MAHPAKVFIDAIPGTGGLKMKIARRVGCSTNTVRLALRRFATVKAAWEAERDRVIDLAEENVITALEAGDVGTARWFLSLRGVERGYKRQTQIDANLTGEIRVIRIGGIDVEKDI